MPSKHPKVKVPVTRQDVLAPKTQKFAIGDLVKTKDDDQARPHEPAGTLFRILSSDAQSFASFGEVPANHQSYREYRIVNVETGYSHAWIDEDDLELVPEHPNDVMGSLGRIEDALQHAQDLLTAHVDQKQHRCEPIVPHENGTYRRPCC